MGTIENATKTVVSAAFSMDNTAESMDNGTWTIHNEKRTVAGELPEPASVPLLTVVVAKASADASDGAGFAGQLAVPCMAAHFF